MKDNGIFAIAEPMHLDNEGDDKILEVDNGRWTSFGYLICKKSL